MSIPAGDVFTPPGKDYYSTSSIFPQVRPADVWADSTNDCNPVLKNNLDWTLEGTNYLLSREAKPRRDVRIKWSGLVN